MKKWIIFSMFLLVVAATLGCASINNNETDVGKVKSINSLDITVLEMKEVPRNKKVKIKIHAKNKGTQPIGIGAGDFYLKIDGKKYTLASGNNFGQEIAKGKEITGYGYYTVPPKIKEAELVYIPQEKELEVWKLGDFND